MIVIETLWGRYTRETATETVEAVTGAAQCSVGEFVSFIIYHLIIKALCGAVRPVFLFIDTRNAS